VLDSSVDRASVW